MGSNSPKPTEPMVPSLKPSHGPNHPDHGSIHCPRCDSTHTKFCYYNNYSLSQPRYFCKSCRRYWTKGGTLRNIPVGGLCRKNKKISSNSKKVPTSATSTAHHHHRRQPSPQPPVDFSLHPHDFMFENLSTNGGGCGDFPAVVAGGGGGCGVDMGNNNYNFTHGLDLETMSFDEYHDNEYYESMNMMMNGIDVKPMVFTLGLQDQVGSGCYSDLNNGSGEGRNGSGGYLVGFGSSCAGLMNGYGSSTAKPLV